MSENRPVISLSRAPRFHHVGIQTNDLENSAAWYEAFLGARPAWSLSDFSELTHSRLPGIRRLLEIGLGEVRIHLIDRAGQPAADPTHSRTQFQHICLSAAAPEDLVRLREHWVALFESGRYAFARPDQPTEIVTDPDGVQSFYALDVNGLEFEFTYVPPAVAGPAGDRS